MRDARGKTGQKVRRRPSSRGTSTAGVLSGWVRALSQHRFLRSSAFVTSGVLSGFYFAEEALGLGRNGPQGPQPFRLDIPEESLRDLRERLSRTRWPDEPPLPPWQTGASLDAVKSLCQYWQTGFDWRAQEARLNAFPQFTVSLFGTRVHFLHVKGKRPDAMPLLLSHGWPGSVFEFLRLIPLLQEDFTLVIPSLPGFPLSFTPGQRRLSVPEMAEAFAELMTDVLGYRRFGVQGGDWGADISTYLGYAYPKRVLGVHLNLLALHRKAPAGESTAEETAYFEALRHFQSEEGGYQHQQGTRPQTLAYGLMDSPAGLAAWLLEKFRAWTDGDGDALQAVPVDELLADVSLYWFTGAIGASFWPYYAWRQARKPLIPDGERVQVPMGYVLFPKDIFRPPQSVAARGYADIRRWTVETSGGHFAALERPEVLAREVRAFFLPLR
ncbi:MAG: epoxide hydrolase family protein [Myxococcaceae bacterium]